MRALVVFESMYGNTHTIADRIADGLRPAFDVTVCAVADATPTLVGASDLVVVGGPTHVHGMSSGTSRRAAVDALAKDDTLVLDEDAEGPGLRDWFDGLGERPVAAAAFDTRIDAPPALTGRASKGISKRLRKHGFRVVADPESFLVDKHSRLLDGEEDRARAWGATLAGLAGQTSITSSGP
jgi:hypothetical protein